MSVFEMSKNLKWKVTDNFHRWYTKIKNFVMGQGVMDIENDVDSEPHA